MIAIVGIPGSTHHRWKWFAKKSEGVKWADDTAAEIRHKNPALGSIGVEVVSDREAMRRRWQDGKRIYSLSVEEGR